MRFEWDPNKASENLRKHGVSFEEAKEVFNDPNRIEDSDLEHSEEESRFLTIGFSSKRLLFVVYCERREDVTRIISARKVTKAEKKDYVQANS